MGGFGSGRCESFGRKRLVEDCQCVTIRSVRKLLHDDFSDTVFLRSAANVVAAVQLSVSPAGFGGDRWWFICPLSRAGTICRRRVRKLYLPDGETYFGCRKCHDLTYRACREAHAKERLAAALSRLRHAGNVNRG